MQKASLTLAQCVVSDTWKSEIQKVIPKELVIDAFLRVTRTIASEMKFSQCDQRSFLGALLKCARAGLAPDGIHAHLIPFGKEVTAIFDWKGVVDLASRNGIEVTPKVICEFDQFSVQEDDGTGKTVVEHRWGLSNRGTIVGYYSRARRSDGSVDYEFMTREEVEHTRANYSNAKNSKAWDKSFDEMAKKTVIKRHSKRWPISQEARAAMSDDDDAIVDAPLPISRPLFEKGAPALPAPAPAAAAPEPEQPAPFEPQESPQPEHPTQAPAEAQQPAGFNPLKALRGLLKMGGIKEGELLDYWMSTNSTDGSQTSLEEVMIYNAQLVDETAKQFAPVAAKIKEGRK